MKTAERENQDRVIADALEKALAALSPDLKVSVGLARVAPKMTMYGDRDVVPAAREFAQGFVPIAKEFILRTRRTQVSERV